MTAFKVGPKPVGLAAKKAALKGTELVKTDLTVEFKKLNPEEMADRIGIVFDDSGSMCSHLTVKDETPKIQAAHAGVEEFLRSCKPAQTAVTIYPMNASKMDLTADLITMAANIHNIEATGGTPLLRTLERMLELEKITRAIVFSDGYPDTTFMDKQVELARAKHIAVDTVFFGGDEPRAIEFMKTLAERTGGVFLHFDPAKMNFRTAFKYLSPGYYGMLSNKSFVADLESGRKN